MRLLGHGLDLVDISRFLRNDQLEGEARWSRQFLPGELAAAGDGSHRASRLAARFAAKEAVLKALGKGWGDGIAFTDVEVHSAPSGAPNVTLHGEAAATAAALAITGWLVSLTHTATVAAASVIALGD